jgi:hypothetical protein
MLVVSFLSKHLPQRMTSYSNNKGWKKLKLNFRFVCAPSMCVPLPLYSPSYAISRIIIAISTHGVLSFGERTLFVAITHDPPCWDPNDAQQDLGG